MFHVKGDVLILGRGKSGESVRDLLEFANPGLKIAFLDHQPTRSDFASEHEVMSQKWGHVVVSPGIPHSPILDELQNDGAEITQELDVAAKFLTDEKIFGITGSVGKSTATHVAGKVFEAQGKKVFIGGNYGIPLAKYALDLQKKIIPKAEFVVLELSSYQIERMAFMLDRGLILNLFPNHLDRYASIEEYYLAKLRMINFCREGVWGLAPGGDLFEFAQLRGMDSKIKWISSEKYSHLFSGAKLLGKHNVECLSGLLEFLASPEVDEAQVIATLNNASALPHRLELIHHNNRTYVNDSKATTIESVLVAYEALRSKLPEQHFLWLLGGRDKNLPWHRLKKLWLDHTQLKKISFAFFGESSEHVKRETGFEGETFPTLKMALSAISKTEQSSFSNSILVLSPGGTSLDEFKNFEERGDFFKSRIASFS